MECDDGNTTNGDGCDSSCKIEPGFSCKLPQDNNGVGKCLTKTKVEFKLDQKINDPLQYSLGFSREVNLD